MRSNRSGWVVASIEACVIVALTIMVLAPSPETAHADVPGANPTADGTQSASAESPIDLDTVREAIRIELDERESRRRPVAPSPAPRDVALDHLRKTRFHHQLDDYLRKGEIAQQELEALQEQAMLLEERDQDAALSRLTRAINQEQLRVRP